jgi:hypothetical protein
VNVELRQNRFKATVTRREKVFGLGPLLAIAEIRILDVRYSAFCQLNHAKAEDLWRDGPAFEYL